jgi:glycosyltransferase involved in cell wall biosynthesis
MALTVSVIIPVYNGARFISAALDSVLAQDVSSMEIIVVDDGSTDETVNIVHRYPQATLLQQENQGPAAARNRGVERASGEFLAFIDADDCWPAGRLRWQIDYLRDHPDVDIVQGKLQPMRHNTAGKTPCEAAHYANSLCTALLASDAFLRVGPLDESLRYCEDLDWFFAAQASGLVVHRSERVALEYLRHADNATNNMDLVRRYTLQVVARHKRRLGGEAT